MFQRLLTHKLPRGINFCLFGAKGVGKTILIKDFATKFSNWIYLDLETTVDRAIFDFEVSAEETLRAISFLKGKDIRGSGTLIVLDEISKCPEAMRWVTRLFEGRESERSAKWTGRQVDKRTSEQVDKWTGGQGDKGTTEQGKGTGEWGNRPLVVAASSVVTKELTMLTHVVNGIMQPYFLHPCTFEEFLPLMDDTDALEAFREVPVPYYAYEKLLNYFHLYALIGGMPEITEEYAASHHLRRLKNIYEKIEDRFSLCLEEVTPGAKSRNLATEVLQNTYPFAATRISLNRFGNIERGSREIGKAFEVLERTFFLRRIQPVTSAKLPLELDTSKFPRLQLLDTGLVNYFSGIQKPLFQSHDMNTIFEGQIARQVVGQEILAAETQESLTTTNPDSQIARDNYKANSLLPSLTFWVRDKAQSTAEVDFIIPYGQLLIPVVVKSGEPGRLRSLHQFMDMAPHLYAVRLYAGKLTVQQTQTIRGKKFYLLNLPYFLAGKIKDHLKGFIRLTNG